jgi:hypothetical protein
MTAADRFERIAPFDGRGDDQAGAQPIAQCLDGAPRHLDGSFAGGNRARRVECGLTGEGVARQLGRVAGPNRSLHDRQGVVS